MLKDLLATYYGIHVAESILVDSVEGYRLNNSLYFTISVEHREVIHMEQATLAYYLCENNYTRMAFPIQNLDGEWFTRYQGGHYMVLKAQEGQLDNIPSQGRALAMFHKRGAHYPYEPQSISSYGQWKQLWIDKLTLFETKIEQDIKKSPSPYSRLLNGALPYIVGISENAIQYMQESESEPRFHEVDQGTIAFRRYSGNLSKSIIWTNDLVYDHPTRDLAEYIRYKLMQEHDPTREIIQFLRAYQEVRQLSIFSWRSLYARLIYPIHLFDLMEEGLLNEDNHDNHYLNMNELLERQTIYERRIGSFFEDLGMDCEKLQMPVLHWL